MELLSTKIESVDLPHSGLIFLPNVILVNILLIIFFYSNYHIRTIYVAFLLVLKVNDIPSQFPFTKLMRNT